LLSISIVIVSYNSERFLKKNLDSLINQKRKFKKIVVVDNNSSDNSVNIIKSFKDVRIISLSKNSGYSAAVNMGIERSGSDIVVIANPDVYFAPDFAALTVEKFKNNEKLDILSPLILRFEEGIVDSAGQYKSLSLFPVEKGFGRELKKIKIEETEIFSVCGAVTVFKRESLQKLIIGKEYYDESFFLFWEDFDIGWRANLFKMKIKFFPDIVAYHYRSGTMKKNFITKLSFSLGRPSEIKFHLIKNRYMTLIKNFRLKEDWFHIPFILIKDIVWVGMLTLSSPKIIIKFYKFPFFFRESYKKRKIIKENE